MKDRLNAPDLVAGAIVMATGAFFAIAGRTLSMGSARSMGPGYFPRLLAWLMLALGAAICVRALLSGRERLPAIEARPILLVMAALAIFTAAIERLGLVIAVVVAVLVASVAIRERHLAEAALLAAGSAFGAWLVFIVLLKLSFPVWPQ